MRSSTPAELADIQVKFDAYASVNGDLFEDGVMPLTEEDMKDVLARRKRFSKIFWIAYACEIAVIGAMLIWGKTPQGMDYFYIIALVGGPLIFRLMITTGFDAAIENNEKRVIHGVITSKKLKGKSCSVEFSRKFRIDMSAADYKLLKLGDIVRMEMLAKDTAIRRRVVVEGKI